MCNKNDSEFLGSQCHVLHRGRLREGAKLLVHSFCTGMVVERLGGAGLPKMALVAALQSFEATKDLVSEL